MAPAPHPATAADPAPAPEPPPAGGPEAGRRAWVAAALARFEGPLVRYATRIVGDPERGRDVVQDTFLRLWEADREQVADHLAAWLFTVCRRRALDVARKEGPMELVAQPSPPPVEATPETAAVRRQEAEGLLAALGALPERQQELVRLRFQEGLSYRELAEVTGLTVSNVGFLLHTALKAVRERAGRA